MSYRLETGESLPEGIRRIAREQAEKAEASLDLLQEDPEEAIHDARKRFKKVRAVLRLVRDEIGEEAYQAENTAYRDMGRLLSDVRDAQVASETLDALTEHYAASLAEDAFSRFRRTLRAHRRLCVHRVVGQAGAVDEVRRRLDEAQARIADWPVERDDFDAVADGLKRVYKRGWKRFADAYDDPSVEAFHEWRKRVKYLWYHTRILGQSWPGPLGEVAEELHHLSNLLGDDHDLAELAELARHLGPRRVGGEATAQALIGLMERRSAELRSAARPVARRIYAEPPKRHVRRHRAYFSAWRRETAARGGLEPVAPR